MLSNKKQIIEYYEDVENSINIQCEKCLQNLQTESGLDDQLTGLNLIRDLFIQTIKELCNKNLDNLTDNSNDIFGPKFCFFLSNDKMKSGPEQNNDNLVFGPAYNFYFENEIGKLVIVNNYIDEKIISELK